ncbi:hypothetical protein BJF92_00600 [Rhizobium rhizosphaerae]|uniref:Uncharacterized protein n=1 Tax=Xaviernesmea rhizosphaerae TaxID=1672749 RepID=A0A1Q9AEI8_9HYPH|nr:hypothetical protein BJF92_00600 [Xaviernesmea rhizosphaerae]
MDSFGTWLGGIAGEVAKAAEKISERHGAGAGENSPVTPIAFSINDGPAIVAHTKDGDIAAVLAAQQRRSSIYSAQIVNAQG